MQTGRQKLNQDYLDKLGLSIEEETKKELPEEKKQDEDTGETEIRINLDADYFQWKEEQNQKKGRLAHKRGKR